MSALTSVHDNDPLYEFIVATKQQFSNSPLSFDNERVFAMNALLNNSYLYQVASKQPLSLQMAMHNVSSIGLSLDPALKLAYLVPRRTKSTEDPKVLVDISYRGLISIGVETGSILAAAVELVHEKDHFQWRGKLTPPVHDFSPFDNDRGKAIGGYCIASLPQGGHIVDAVSLEYLDKVRDGSEAYKKNFGPWMDWESEMQLKTIVKHAFKWWPTQNPRMGQAIHLLNTDNGEGLAELVQPALPAPELEPVNQIVSEQEFPADFRKRVNDWVKRAINTNAFETCKAHMEERIKDKRQLIYALAELDKAKPDQAQIDEASVV